MSSTRKPVATKEGLREFWTWWAEEVRAGRIHGMISEPLRAYLEEGAEGGLNVRS